MILQTERCEWKMHTHNFQPGFYAIWLYTHKILLTPFMLLSKNKLFWKKDYPENEIY